MTLTLIVRDRVSAKYLFGDEYTTGKTVIISRKTLDKIPGKLLGCNILAFSKTRHSLKIDKNGKISLLKASLNSIFIAAALSNKSFVVIGGPNLYSQAINFCSKIIIIKLKTETAPLVYFPKPLLEKYFCKSPQLLLQDDSRLVLEYTARNLAASKFKPWPNVHT